MPTRRTDLVILALLGACAPAPATAPPGAPAPAPDAYVVPDLPPGRAIPAEEYARRRAALAARMEDGVLLALGAPAPAADYLPFHQDPDFRYLTGITEPNAALVMVKRDGRVHERLFVAPRDPAREIWEGERLGAEGAQLLTGIPSAPVSRLLPALDTLLAGAPRLYTTADLAPAAGPFAGLTPEQQFLAGLAAGRNLPEPISVEEEVERLRAEKSETELDLIRRAVFITNLAHRAAMRSIEPGMNEFEIQALIEYFFRRYGAERPAFSSIVGSGPNATTLHYNADDRFMEAGDVVVMDVGASYRGYAADVTRTVPVSGRFSPDQRAIYEIVLAAQKAAEARVRPGATWNELNAAAAAEIAAGLARLGLIDAPGATYDCGEPGAPRRCPQYTLFFMHGLGHGIGLEVHDPEVSYYGPFAVGSAFTIEPGIYVREDALAHLPDTPANREMIARLAPAVSRYANIGVRIEDDYVITPGGVERLSAGAPREPDEIEAMMALPGIASADRRAALVEWYRQTEPRR